jgi:hypothetical protein
MWGMVIAFVLATLPAWGDVPKYDPGTVTTLSGEVLETGGGLFRMLGMEDQEQIVIRTDRETLNVILGPTNYLNSQNYKPEKGQRVEVIGSRVISENKPVILARQVNRGNDFLVLRASDGTPAWTKPMGVPPVKKTKGKSNSPQVCPTPMATPGK